MSDMRRDANNLYNNDHFAVMIDTFNDRRNGYVFYANAQGGMADSQVANENANTDWNTIWETKSADFDGGWTIEFRIPFRSIRFQEAARVWGINFRRNVRWKTELSFLAAVPVSYGSNGSEPGVQCGDAGRDRDARPPAESGRQRLCAWFVAHQPRGATGDLEPGRRRVRPRCQVGRHPELRLRRHVQHRLCAGRRRRAAAQPDAVLAAVSREARVLHGRRAVLRLRHPERRPGQQPGDPGDLFQPPHRPRERRRRPDCRRWASARPERPEPDRRPADAHRRRARAQCRRHRFHRDARAARDPAAQPRSA